MSNAPRKTRSFERIETADLLDLAEISHRVLKRTFQRRPQMQSLYADKLVGICLCQGAASHYLQYGSADSPGINDFDIWAFYELTRSVPFYNRAASPAYFRPSKFGRSANDPEHYVGRRVDVFWRAIPACVELDPMAAIRRFFIECGSQSARELRKKPAIVISPAAHVGEVIWNPFLR